MVAGSNTEGGQRIVTAGVRKSIQSVEEIVDPFHEASGKRDKWKEVPVFKNSITSQPRKRADHVHQGMRLNTYSDRSFRRGGYSRNALPDARISKEFRVVRDNRTNQITNSEIKPSSAQNPISTNEPVVSKVSEKRSPTGASSNQKPLVGHHPSQSSNGKTELQPRQAMDDRLSDRKDSLEDRRSPFLNAGSGVQSMTPSDFQPNFTISSNNSVGGVSSSSDPVHVPSPDSRPANVGAIKREVGVGVRRQSTENSIKLSSAQSTSFSNSHLGRDGPSIESVRSIISKSDQPSQTPVPESAMSSISVSRPFMSTQYGRRHLQPVAVGHQKASHTNKDWKPKLNQKQRSSGPGVIGTPAKSASPLNIHKDLETEAAQLQDKLLREDVSENQNVFIAAHIRVSEIDRCRLTFGSLGTGLECSRNSGFQSVGDAEESHVQPSASLSISAPESSSDETFGSKQVDSLDECVRNSGTKSPASCAVSEQPMIDSKLSSSLQDLDSYAAIGLVRDKSPSYNPSESQQQQDPHQLTSFSAYDSQAMYDPYIKPSVAETARWHGLLSPRETLSSPTANSIPASTLAMVQQPQMAQMFPQFHGSNYANLVPYRQFLSPVYVPPMALPGYSNSAAYPHPSNGNSYLLMPGGSSHVNASGLKYGIQPFKPVPPASPSGFGNLTSAIGYAINTPGVISATGPEDLARVNYKDANLYVPNPQAEISEIWINQGDLPSFQSSSYYNMTGQTPHAAYLPSHTGHASLNAGAQSSHMQFPGMYHPPQPTGIPSPHHLGTAMVGNVGVGMGAGAPGVQVGAYQQPQLGQMNWTGNF